MKPGKNLFRNLLAALVCLLFFLPARSQARNGTVSLSVSDGTLLECIRAIEGQTDYTFLFNNDVDTSVKTSCQYTGEELE